MNWWYKLIQKTSREYIYAYSRESEILDGVIIYDTTTKTARIEKESSTDSESIISLNASLRHFIKVVREGFPAERHVCCG